jgi:uncharacterized protein (TIGR00255 family)
MLRSMTGFGEASGEVDGAQYSVEIRSVNNRYCKCVLRLPEICSPAEPEIEKILRSRLRRGMITVTVKLTFTSQRAYRIDTDVLSGYIEQLRPLEVDANPLLRIDLGSMLQLPGVCAPSAAEGIFHQTREGLLTLAEQAIDKLAQMRELEGGTIEAHLTENINQIREKLGGIVERNYQERLVTRVQELINSTDVVVDAEVLAREVAIFADRCDIAEETTRLKAHLDHLEQAIATATDPVGRKLDFIAQEMLREANTIAAKANDTQIGQTVVEIKTAIDRIKEQVQNVE